MTAHGNAAAAPPDEPALRGLLRGTLPASDEAAVLAQLEREPAWQAALDRLAADEATWRAAAQSLARPPLAADATLRSALAGVAALDRSHSSVNTPTGSETLDSSTSESVSASDLRFLAPANELGYLGQLGSLLVEEVIGRGGFGLVLKARDPKLARIVAIKVLAPHLAASGNACQRFEREAKAAAAVTHEHVITIYSVESKPPPHLVMQFVAGQSLQDKLDREGPLGVKETLRIGMQTAAGLAAAHKQGLVHRDVKPANILLENGIERVKLTDFGLARAADDASLTRSGTIAGTPQFMSPEQARGESVDVRSDLFSLGAVLYAMLTGRSPFRADSTLAVLKRVCDDPPRPIREVNPDVPDWLAVLITRLLAKNPDDRPASAQQVADQLGHYLSQLQHPGAAHKLWHAVATVPTDFATSQPISAAAASAAIPEAVRRRIDRLAYVHLFLMALSAIGFVVAAIVFGNTWRYDNNVAMVWFVPMWVLALSLPLPLITALLALRRASYWVLMAGTVLTLCTAGFFNLACWPVSMGLMVWVLVELQRDDIRAALAAATKPRLPKRPTESAAASPAPARLERPAASDIASSNPARWRVDRIAYVHLFIIVLSLIGTIAAALAFLDTYRSPGRDARLISVWAVVVGWVLGLSMPIPLATALLALRRASYTVLLTGTVLTLLTAGLFNVACWPISMGLMIWVLVELQREDVRAVLAGSKSTLAMSTHLAESPAMLALPPVLAKPAKPDPFASAPAAPRRSRLASILLGLGLVVGGLTMLGCLGSLGTYFFHHSDRVAPPVHAGRLIVKVPDRRLAATLRLRKADHSSYTPGVAIETYNDQIQVIPDNAYLLRAGEYELTVKSDDATVFAAPIRINEDGGPMPQTFEVKPGGVVSIETQPAQALMTVELNGHVVIQTANIPSQRMLVVPEGTIRLKSFFGEHVFSENWFELKAGETLRVRVTDRTIEPIAEKTGN